MCPNQLEMVWDSLGEISQDALKNKWEKWENSLTILLLTLAEVACYPCTLLHPKHCILPIDCLGKRVFVSNHATESFSALTWLPTTSHLISGLMCIVESSQKYFYLICYFISMVALVREVWGWLHDCQWKWLTVKVQVQIPAQLFSSYETTVKACSLFGP